MSTAEDKKKYEEMIGVALERLNVVSNRASPMCPFMKDEQVFKRLAAPQTRPADWVKAEHQEKKKQYIADEPEIKSILAAEGNKEYSLKHKLRDHVAEIFDALSHIDEAKNISNATESYTFCSRMKQEMKDIDNEHRLKKNNTSLWSEQRARAKAIGLEGRH